MTLKDNLAGAESQELGAILDLLVVVHTEVLQDGAMVRLGHVPSEWIHLLQL